VKFGIVDVGALFMKASRRTSAEHSQDFVAQDKCKEVALQQMGEDADVVFQVAGGCGLGALQGAKEQKWGLGVDNDQGFLGNHVLTSATKKVDVGVRETIRLAMSNRWKGGVDTLFQREEQGRRLRKAVEDGAEPCLAGEPPRQVVA
jgi:basic membrane protein A and related proteins